MANLSPAQLTAIASGQPIRQVYSILAPASAAHSAYLTTVIDNGLLEASDAAVRRVLKSGSRNHKVWNPHPMEDNRPEAVRLVIEVANGDGYFHERSGSPWNPYGIYAASASECFLLHQLYVWDAAASTWSPITHMDFKGRVLSVDYSGAGSMIRRDNSGSTLPGIAPNVATITCEQVGAWETLRRVFNKDDGTRTTVGTFTALGTALTLTSMTPSSVVHGGGDILIDVYGTGFSTRTEIRLDDVPKTTNYTSSTHVSFTLKTAERVTAGTRSVVAHVFGAGGSTSNTLTLTVT